MTWDSHPDAPQDKWELERMKREYLGKFTRRNWTDAEKVEEELRSLPLKTYYIVEWISGFIVSPYPIPLSEVGDGYYYAVDGTSEEHVHQIVVASRIEDLYQ